MAKQTVQIGDSGADLISKLGNNFSDLYNSTNLNVYCIQEGDVIGSSEWWIAGTVYEIAYNYDFEGATITLPENVVLVFKGGIFSNGTILGNKSSFSVSGLFKAFETNLTLSGTWKTNEILPQYYGAVTNASASVNSNSCVAAIQKCLDSPFTVTIPSGYYYFDTPLIITKEQVVNCTRGVLDKTGTIFYTDQNTDFCIIRKSEFHFLGMPLIDYTSVTSCSKGAFVYDMDYYIIRGEIQASVIGNSATITEIDNGVTGCIVDARTNIYVGNLYHVKVYLACIYVRYCVWTTPKTGTRPAEVWCIENQFYIEGLAYKQMLRLEFANNCVFKGFGQAFNTLDETEKSLSTIYLNEVQSCTFDLEYIWDNSPNADVNGHYRNNLILIDLGRDNFYPRNMIDLNSLYGDTNNFQFNENGRPANTAWIETPNKFIWGHNKLNDIYFPGFTYIRNDLSWINKKVEGVTILPYNGTGYDFDTNLIESTGLAASTDITISYPENMFALRGYDCYAKFTNADALDTHFIEVVIPVNNKFYSLYFRLYGLAAMFKRVQTILIWDGGSKVSNKYPVFGKMDYDKTILPFDGYSDAFQHIATKLIIRFIGCSSINNEVVFSEIFGAYKYFIDPPIIDLGGGQTIYGNLAVKDGVKETALPVYADNASALAGGLTAGMPYRTSTGIRMVAF